MEPLVSYRREDAVAYVTMDDGKLNALSPRMCEELGAALQCAAEERAVVVLAGREGAFSAGFDLKVLRGDAPAALALLRAGFELAERVLAFPRPVVVACSGHAIAMGAFLLLAADYRIGALGPYKLTANEVAIGMTMPHAAVALCRQRLAPAQFSRALIVADVFAPGEAVQAGFLDEVVPASELVPAARARALALAKLDPIAHAATKLRVRAESLELLRRGIEADQAELSARA